MKLAEKLLNMKESNKDLDNPKPNRGLTYDEWKNALVNKYGKKVKFVSQDTPATSRTAEVNGKMVDLYTFPRK